MEVFLKVVTNIGFVLEWPTFIGRCVDSASRLFNEWNWGTKENPTMVPCSECKAKCMTLDPCVGCECWENNAKSLIRARPGTDTAEMDGLFLGWRGGTSDSYPTKGWKSNGGTFTCHAKPRGKKYELRKNMAGFKHLRKKM